MIKNVIKRSGEVVPFDASKLVEWVEWADVVGVDWTGIVTEVFNKSEETVSTKALHNSLIRACVDMQTTAHSYLAGRLFIGDVYKTCYGGHGAIPDLKTFYKEMTLLGYWEELNYSDEELEYLEGVIDHTKDLTYTHSQLKQIIGKYSARDKTKKDEYIESPQFTYMGMALAMCKNTSRYSTLTNIPTRMEDVVAYYEYYSRAIINCPTPNYNNLRTFNRGYASCCVYTVDDNIPSLAAGDHIAYSMTAASAGIGSMLKTRSIGEPVRGGTIKHSGKIPYYRAIESAVGANLQAGRGGAATVYLNHTDPEIRDLIWLRNPKSVDSKRVDNIDYCFSNTTTFRKYAAEDLEWPLFSYKGNEEVFDAMYLKDDSLFVDFIENSRENGKLEFVSARGLCMDTLQSAQETGRFYDFNITEVNRHTPFKEPIWMSNLCLELAQPCTAYYNVSDLYEWDEGTKGEISLCSLSAIVAGSTTLEFEANGKWTQQTLDEYYKACYYALRGIDTVIDMMDYPFPHLEYTAKQRRNAGVGITNLAHCMASMGLKYTSTDGKVFVHNLAELHAHSLLRASITIAKERGVCGWAGKTCYPEGWTPLETYNRNVDTIADFTNLLDWEPIREELIALGGAAFSVHCNHMPTESSSIAGNLTNGLYPIRKKVTIKGDGEKKVTFLAPDLDTLGDQYEIAWDIPTKDMAEIYAIVQKFCCQAISADYYLKRSNEDNTKYSADEMMEDYLYAGWLGVKTRYYSNSRNGGQEVEIEDSCGDSCKL